MTGSPAVDAWERPDGAGPRVSLARRFLALMIDWVLCLMAAGLIGNPRSNPWAAPVVLVLLYTFFVGLFGQTPGMWITRMRCVRVEDGAPIGLGRAVLRAILLAAVLPALAMDGDQRGLHDRLADSMVLPVNWPVSG